MSSRGRVSVKRVLSALETRNRVSFQCHRRALQSCSTFPVTHVDRRFSSTETTEAHSPDQGNNRLRDSDGSVWNDVTLRLLKEPWKSSVERDEALRTIDWWAQRPGGGVFTIKLLEKFRDEISTQGDQNALESDALSLDRIRSIAERWAMDYTSDQHFSGLKDPSEIARLLDSLRKHAEVDQTILDLIHRTSARQHASQTDPKNELPLNEKSLLSKLAHVEKTGDLSSCPSFEQIDDILRHVVKESDVPNVQWVQNVLDAMWSITRTHDYPQLRPNFSIYQSLLRAWLKSKEPAKSFNMQRIIDDMEEKTFRGEKSLFPGNIHYGLLMSAYGEEGNIKGALKLKKYMSHRYQKTGSQSYKLSSQMYGSCMAALSRTNDPDKLKLAETLKDEILKDASIYGPEAMPRAPFWTSYISVLSGIGTAESLEKAESVLNEMRTDRGPLRPNIRNVGPIIRGWGRLKRPDRAEHLLLWMNEEYIYGNESAKPDPKAFLDVLNAWSTSDLPEAPKRIRHLNQMMADMHGKSKVPSTNIRESDGEDLSVQLFKMLSTASSEGDAEKAEHLLREKIAESQKGEGHVKLTQKHYQAVITAWSKTRNLESAARAESLLHEMLEKYDAGDANLRPQEHGFTSVISAHGRSGRFDCGRRAQAIFDEMLRRFQGGETALQPSVHSYSALITAWANQGRPDRAEAVLQQMHDDFLAGNNLAKPNTSAFNATLMAWSKDTSEEALKRAVNVLDLLRELNSSNLHISPNIVSFSTTVACCIKSKAPWRTELAESLLQEAKDLYANGRSECRPNCMIYGAVIQTLSRSDTEGAAERSEGYLQEMLALSDFDPRQILLSHNAIIGAWSRDKNITKGAKRAEALVLNLVRLSRERRTKQCLPNQFTYSALFSALMRTSPKVRQERAKIAIEEMKALGIEADNVVRKLATKCMRGE